MALAWAAVALFAVVALRDLLARTIDHVWLAGLGALWLGQSVAQGADAWTMLLHLAVALAAFVILIAAFALGWIAGGDVKLAAVVFLWAGPEYALAVGFVVAMAGGLVALSCLMADLLLRLPLPAKMGAGLGLMSVRRGVPYGIALSSGGILAVLASSGGGG